MVKILRLEGKLLISGGSFEALEEGLEDLIFVPLWDDLDNPTLFNNPIKQLKKLLLVCLGKDSLLIRVLEEPAAEGNVVLIEFIYWLGDWYEVFGVFDLRGALDFWRCLAWRSGLLLWGGRG